MEKIASEPSKDALGRSFIIAWIFGCIFYFLQYVIRSSPAVMIPELTVKFGISPLGVSAILGTYYYTYALISLVAGTAYDRAGAKYPIAVGAGIICAGCLLFAAPSIMTGNVGRLLQGAGSAFSFTGCVYLASRGFSSKYLATAIGLTQCVGMLGGSAGQFVTGPLIHSGLPVNTFWIFVGSACGIVSVLLFFTTPKEDKSVAHQQTSANILMPYKIVFTNIQSYLSGIISGLLFAPTTVFAMTWGISFLQEDRLVNYQDAVFACAMVPFGWVIGCPLLGWISDKIGRRKPVLIFGILGMALTFSQLVFFQELLPVPLTMLLFGISSGTAMIPYTIIKEANPDHVKGSATGAINFITFGITSCIGPIFAAFFGKTLSTTTEHLAHFKSAGIFLISVILLALIFSFIIKETAKKAVPV